MSPAVRQHRLRDLVERLDEAHITLNSIGFGTDANVAKITLSEVDFVRSAIAAAADFIHELNEREIEARTAGDAA